MARNTYDYNGREYHSIKDLALHVNVNEKTLAARLRRGMSVEEACTTMDLRCSYYEDESIEKSIVQMCKDYEKDESLVRNRLRYGYSMSDALNKPKKVSRQGIPVVVNGVLYNSISAALVKLDLKDKEQTVRRRLKLGMSPDVAFSFDKFD